MLTNTPQTMQGRTAVISGSSRGIGAAIARELSSRGANIVLNYPFDEFEDECLTVGQSLSTPWIAVKSDLSTVEGPKQLVEAAAAKFQHIDFLIHNAARVHMGKTEELTAQQYAECFDLNSRGAFLLVKAALPHLKPYKPASPPVVAGGVRNGSRIIIIGSGASKLPQPGSLLYAATKGSLESMIRIWSTELPQIYGCTVNGVAPGPVQTELLSHIDDQMDHMMTMFAERTPCEGSLAHIDDISWMVAMLAEDRSKWVNGQYIHVNGGLIRS